MRTILLLLALAKFGIYLSLVFGPPEWWSTFTPTTRLIWAVGFGAAAWALAWSARHLRRARLVLGITGSTWAAIGVWFFGVWVLRGFATNPVGITLFALLAILHIALCAHPPVDLTDMHILDAEIP